jgi:hypothetical protein
MPFHLTFFFFLLEEAFGKRLKSHRLQLPRASHVGQCVYYLWGTMNIESVKRIFSLQDMNGYLKRHYKSVLCQEIFSEGVRPA